MGLRDNERKTKMDKCGRRRGVERGWKNEKWMRKKGKGGEDGVQDKRAGTL